MSQYYSFFVNKNYLVFAILATVLVIPVSYVAAEFIFSAELADVASDGDSGFTFLNGATGIATFTNSSNPMAIVVSFDDDAVNVVDLSNPQNIRVQDSIVDEGANGGGETSEGNLVLSGPRDVVLFDNTTANEYALVVAYQDDGIQIFDIQDPLADTSHSIYPATNYTDGTCQIQSAGLGVCNQPLNGAMSAAIWTNSTNSGTYAIVTGFLDDGITTFDITDPEVGGAIYTLSNATKTGSHGKAFDISGTAGAEAEINGGGRLLLDGAWGVATFYKGDSHNMPYAIVTGQISDGFEIFSLNNTEYAIHQVMAANKTKASAGFGLLDSPTGVATWNTTNTNDYAIITSNATDSVTVVNLYDQRAPSVSDTLSNNGVLALDGAMDVAVSKIGDRHYAFVSSNGTGASDQTGGQSGQSTSGGLQVIDLYDPTNIQPVTSAIDEGGLFTKLAKSESVGTFVLDGHTYAAVTSYGDDSIIIIQITKDKPSSNNRQCGVSADCSPPTISKHGTATATDGFSINNANFASESRYNDVDTVEAKVGSMVTIKANIYDAFGADNVYKANLYFDIPNMPDWSEANAAIEYDILRDEIAITDNNDIFDASASSRIVGDRVEVTFKIMFTGNMDTSHIALQSIDNSRNYQLIYFRDALQVTGTPTQTGLEGTIDGEVTQTSTASVPAWVKNTAGWWAEGQISEGEFVKGVEYLIQQQIIDTDVQTTTSTGTGSAVPDWVKNTAGWWADGQISENEFVNAIEHLVKTGTIIII